MGALGGIRTFAIAAGATAAATGLALHATGTHALREHELRAERNRGRHPTEFERQGTGFLDNLDGLARLGLLAGSAVAGVAALTSIRSAPHRAALLGGAALGSAAAAILAGAGPFASRVETNGRSVATAFGAGIRARLQPERPDVDAAARDVATTDAPRATRPSAAAIRAAELPLPGTPDEELARANAARALAQVDWSKPDVVLWMPGTGEHVMTGQWTAAVEGTLERPASAVLIDHPASLDFDASVATGMRSLQLVLAGIAERGGDRRVLAAGYSQGGWMIGDAMSVPEIRDSIDRAVLFGHPGLAVNDYADGHDPKVLEVNDGNDPITWAVPDRRVLIDAMRDLHRGEALQHPLRAIASATQNPVLTEYWTARMVDPERWPGNDPHEYYGSYDAGLDWLDEAPAPRVD
jgi:hypothetical protein